MISDTVSGEQCLNEIESKNLEIPKNIIIA